MTRTSIILIMIIMLSISMFSQEPLKPDTIEVRKIPVPDEPTVMNIRHRIEDEKIIVTYDLLGRDIGRAFEISVLVSVSPNPLFHYRPKRVYGDVGAEITLGRGKQIIWDYKSEIGNDINEDDVRFRVTIQEYRPGSGSTAVLLRSIFLPGLGQVYDGSNIKGTLFILGAIGAGSFFYFSHTSYAEEVEHYNKLRTAYVGSTSAEDVARLRSELNEKYKKVNDAHRIRNIALYTIAGLYTLNIIDALIFHTRRRDVTLYSDTNTGIKLQPRLSYTTHGIAAGLQITF